MKQAPDSSTDAAVIFRNELLDRAWPDAVGISTCWHKEFMLTEATAIADRLRTQRRLLGVWSPRSNALVFPDFQFDETGRLLPVVTELLAILPEDRGSGGWREAFWLYSPHALLDGRCPAEVFAEDARRVIDAAKTEFSAGPGDHW